MNQLMGALSGGHSLALQAAAQRTPNVPGLSASAKSFLQADGELHIDLVSAGASSSWKSAVSSFVKRSAAVGLATFALASGPATAESQAPEVPAVTTVVNATPAAAGPSNGQGNTKLAAASPGLVSIANIPFSDLVRIRDRIGLDEATLRDYAMPLLDEGSIARMDAKERILVVGGLYWAAESLDGFDRSTAQARADLEKMGAPQRTHAEEVEAWQRWLDSAGKERQSYRRQIVQRQPAVAPVQPNEADLENTILHIQTLVIPRGTAQEEIYNAYQSMRP